MENDSIRSSGSSTLVDIWIGGKLRGICVSREAIESFLGVSPDRAAAMSEDDRCEFIRTHLSQVVTAAANRLRDTNPAADTILIDAGQLGTNPGAPPADRRKSERRKGDRRKPERPGERPAVDRRRGDRRKSDRRSPPKGRNQS